MFEEAQAALKARIEAVKAKYAPQIEELQKEGKKLEDDTEHPSDIGVILGVDFKIEWKDEELIFDVPSITIKNQGISLDLPEIGRVDNTSHSMFQMSEWWIERSVSIQKYMDSQ